MRLRSLLSAFAAMLLLGSMSAQDAHYTQFYSAPMLLNPSLTGAYEGTFRVGGIYRDQWAAVAPDQFITPTVYIDAPAFRGFGKRDWVGIGASFLFDQAGALGLTTTNIMGSVAYHAPLGASNNTTLSVGFQAGYVGRSLNPENAITADGIINGTPSIDPANFMENTNFFDMNAGIGVNHVVNQNLNFNAGFSVFHLTSPDNSLLDESVSEDPTLDQRYTAHAKANIGLTNTWMISPAFLFQSQAGATETDLQVLGGYHLNTEKDITLRFGPGYRFGDAMQAIVGLDYKGLRVGAAYDINTSDLSAASNNRGGFEIGASYIFRIYNPPVVKTVIFCPRF